MRMVVDVARSFNQWAPTIEEEAMPPRCSHLARAAQSLPNASNSGACEKSQMGLNEIRSMLKFISRRWGMAGKYTCQKSTVSK